MVFVKVRTFDFGLVLGAGMGGFLLPEGGAWTAVSPSRGQTVEPLNGWFKGLLELGDRVRHRGLDNSRTQILAAVFAHQPLLRYSGRCGNESGQVRWVMDVR